VGRVGRPRDPVRRSRRQVRSKLGEQETAGNATGRRTGVADRLRTATAAVHGARAVLSGRAASRGWGQRARKHGNRRTYPEGENPKCQRHCPAAPPPATQTLRNWCGTLHSDSILSPGLERLNRENYRIRDGETWWGRPLQGIAQKTNDTFSPGLRDCCPGAAVRQMLPGVR
jgi:hypothetical protein